MTILIIHEIKFFLCHSNFEIGDIQQKYCLAWTDFDDKPSMVTFLVHPFFSVNYGTNVILIQRLVPNHPWSFHINRQPF